MLAAYQAGIRSFDGAAGGLGGCPFAPGATGNIASEDLVYLFERMGVDTGIDLAKLLEAAELALSFAPQTVRSNVLAMPRERALFGSERSMPCRILNWVRPRFPINRGLTRFRGRLHWRRCASF